jgi:hypothetical protein
MMESAPFSAPAWPPETGASMKPLSVRRGDVGEFAGDRRGSGCVVDEDGAGPEPCESAVCAQSDAAQIIVIADAGEDEVLALGDRARRHGEGAAEFGDPFLRLCRGAIIDRDGVALFPQMPSHRIAHNAETDKPQFRHRRLSRLVRRTKPVRISIGNRSSRFAGPGSSAAIAI